MIASDPTANGWRHSCHRSSSSDSPEFDEEPLFGSDESPATEPPPDPFAPLLVHLAELREYAGVYCAARIDQWWIKAQGLAFNAAAGLIGALFGMTALIVAAALLVNGLATGIGILCGGNIWLGQIIVGALFMLLAVGSVGMAGRYVRGMQHRRVVNKYESRKRRERATFGTDVAERAAGDAAE
jgi:hypothetical protein